MSLGLIIVGSIIGWAAIIWTLIVGNTRIKIVLGAVIIALGILSLILPGRNGSVVFEIGVPILGICCLLYLLWNGYLFKIR